MSKRKLIDVKASLCTGVTAAPIVMWEPTTQQAKRTSHIGDNSTLIADITQVNKIGWPIGHPFSKKVLDKI